MNTDGDVTISKKKFVTNKKKRTGRDPRTFKGQSCIVQLSCEEELLEITS